MLINSGTNSIVDEIDALCSSDSTSYQIGDKIRRVNSSLEELVGDIINADGTFEYDDTNLTDLPRGTATLVEGQESYTFDTEYLQILQMEILDLEGSYRKILPLDRSELGELSPAEYFGLETNGDPKKGFPRYFDLIGDSFFLYPAPAAVDCTLAAGLRVWFKRTIDLFTTSDTTQAPGLPSTHHILLAYMAAIPYCASYKPERVAFYQSRVNEMRASLKSYYAKRDKTRRKVMTSRFILHR